MKINYTSKNYKISNNFKEVLEKKLERLEKYFDNDVEVRVNCENQRNNDKLEITINSKGMYFRSEVLSDNMYNNIDDAMPKIEKQIVKHGSKKKSKFKKDAFVAIDPMFDDLLNDEMLPTVVKQKSFKLEPLSVEDAQAYMEALDHNFYVFLNAHTGMVNVVYKRNDQNYGLIEVNY